MSDQTRHYPTFREAVGESIANAPSSAKAALKAAVFCAVMTPLVAGILSLGLMAVRAVMDWEAFSWELLGGTINSEKLARYLARTEHFALVSVVGGLVLVLLAYTGRFGSKRRNEPGQQ